MFLGFAYHIGHKGYMLKQIGKRKYFVAMRSVTFDPERFPYLKPVKPEDARWAKPGEENDQPVLDFGLIEDVDEEEIEVPEPSEIEVVLEDFDDEPGGAASDVVPEDVVRNVQTRSMTRVRSKGDSDKVITTDSDEQIAPPEPDERFEPEIENATSSNESDNKFQMKPFRCTAAVAFTATNVIKKCEESGREKFVM